MTDFFAILGEPRRPWTDPDALKEKYHRLTARHHPDIAGASADFAEINHAYQTLADPVARLRHLLELECAVPPAQQAPGEIAAFFAPVAGTRQAVDAFFKKHAAAVSPLAKALLSPEQFETQERIEEMIASLQEKHDALLEQVREADAAWPGSLAQLAPLWQSLTYTAKWLAMLREALFRFAAI
ncbi:MAG TPA: DnaJ domain-containing protein [Chthoniobacteraceae bacterium]|nr:DnaJ domain-containing protein [Chthoniobacteraceae bacterium]